MKILITGSSGFIGTALGLLLRRKGISVVEYDIRNKKNQDVRSFRVLLSYARGMDGIIHLAAVSRVKWGFENPRKCVDVNIRGTENVLEVARSLTTASGNKPWVIFGSSREVFGEVPELPADETTVRMPLNVYGITKLAGEELCKIYSDNYLLKTRVLRFSNVYSSPHDHLDRVVPKFITAAAQNKPITIHGSGDEFFDFTYIDDAADGVWRCIGELNKKSIPLFDDFILCTGKPVPFKTLADLAIAALNSKSEITFSKARSYDVSKFYGNPSKAKLKLGFSPKTDIKKGIKLVIEKFRKANVV